MKIPFNLLPASWGLKGKSRQIAEAEYYLAGYELDVELAKIEHGIDTANYNKQVILIDRQYNRIDQYTADVKLSELEHAGNENAAGLTKLDIDLKYDRISQQDFDRKRADLLGEPYMAMPKISWDPVDPSKTYFELDYNQAFVEYLRENGYVGIDEDVINKWLNDVCSSILSEMAPVDPEFVSNVRRVRRDDGKVEHS
jgi:hypothetical protein